MTHAETLAPESTDPDASPVGPVTYVAGAVLLVLWGAVATPFLSPMMLFAPVLLPVALWVAWNDMAHMRIPNQAVSVVLLAWAILGLFAYPVDVYLWRWSHFAVMITLGFVANLFRLVGAGDAKFIAAVAPLFALEDASGILRIFAAMLLAAFAAHRSARAIPKVRALVPDWESWERRDFPMGLALAGVVATYVVLLATYGR